MLMWRYHIARHFRMLGFPAPPESSAAVMAPAIGTKLCWRILREQRGVLGVTRMSVRRYCCSSIHARDNNVDEEKLSALRKIYP